MSHGLKLLLIAAGAIITCIVVVVGFQLTKSGKGDTNKASEELTSVMAGYDEIKLTCYEDQTISGSEVISFIQDNAGALVDKQITEIKTITNAASNASKSYLSSAGYTDVNAVKSAIKTNQSVVTETYYVNPKGKFLCTITRNSNGMISVITFDQQ